MYDIRFIKTLSYDTCGDEGFGYMRRLLRGELDPKSDAPGQLQLPDRAKIFHSPARRVRECLPRGQDNYVELNDLAELTFDPSKFIDEKIWREQGSNAVRQAFILAFELDGLDLKCAEIFEQVEKLLDMCREKAGKQEVICVSHSFRMKLIEAYATTGGEIKKSPLLIREFVSPDRRTYEFGGGFTI